MKKVEELITRIRRETRNATTGTTTAGASIPDAFFVDKLQDAQELCVELISGVFSTLFEEVYIHTINTSVANYEVITLPSSMIMGTRIVLVEYSYSGAAKDYVNVPPVDIRERYSGSSYLRSIFGYIHTGNQIILSEIPNRNGSKLRITYEKRLRRLDTPKTAGLTFAEVSSPTTYNIFYPVATADATFVSSLYVGGLISIVDTRDDSLMLENATILSLNTGTGSILMDITNATYVSTAAMTATPDANQKLIYAGSISKSELPSECEKFLTAWAIMDTLQFDGSKLAQAAEKRFAAIQESILKSYLTASKDWPAVPELNY